MRRSGEEKAEPVNIGIKLKNRKWTGLPKSIFGFLFWILTISASSNHDVPGFPRDKTEDIFDRQHDTGFAGFGRGMRGMGRQDDVFQPVKRIIRRQRLLFEDVETG